MKIGILGTGDVGKTLANAFLDLGYEVMMGSRDASNEKLIAWQKSSKPTPQAKIGTFAETCKFADLIVLATLGTITDKVIQQAGIGNFAKKIVWDATNPLDMSGGMPPKLVGGLGTSAGEIHQKMIPEAMLVKVFNTVGNAQMYKPKIAGQIKPDMFICGNDEAAKAKTRELLSQFGWETVDIGPISTSHYLEAMCLVWVHSALKSNQWMQAFKLLNP